MFCHQLGLEYVLFLSGKWWTKNSNAFSCSFLTLIPIYCIIVGVIVCSKFLRFVTESSRIKFGSKNRLGMIVHQNDFQERLKIAYFMLNQYSDNLIIYFCTKFLYHTPDHTGCDSTTFYSRRARFRIQNVQINL